MTNLPQKIESTSHLPNSSLKEVLLIFSISIEVAVLISIFTCIVPIIFWFI